MQKCCEGLLIENLEWCRTRSAGSGSRGGMMDDGGTGCAVDSAGLKRGNPGGKSLQMCAEDKLRLLTCCHRYGRKGFML